MSKKELSFSICMPVYNGASWLNDSLGSILYQGFQNFEIIICDDCSTDNSLEIIKGFKDKRIKVFQNQKNLGYGKNMQKLTSYAKADVLFLMAQDDVLLKNALQKTHDAFFLDDDVGAVARPYYQFIDNIYKPVRLISLFNEENTAISVVESREAIYSMFDAVGQLSGLAYLSKYLTPFHQDVFPSHIYPFAEIAKKHKIAFLKDFTVAIRIPSSQTRFKSSIYNDSPTLTWIKMIERVFKAKKYQKARKYALEQTATNFVGLVQIKNYSSFKNLIREIFFLIKFRPLNLFDIRFWFFSLGSILVPRKVLIWMVDNFKEKISARLYKNIIDKDLKS